MAREDKQNTKSNSQDSTRRSSDQDLKRKVQHDKMAQDENEDGEVIIATSKKNKTVGN